MKALWILFSFLIIWTSGHAASELPGSDTATRHLLIDYDNDGLKDLFVLHFPGNRLFRNSGDGSFDDVTSTAFPEGAGAGIAGSWCDYDRDGWPDLFLFHNRGFTLFRNDTQGRFIDVTVLSNLDPKLKGTRIRLEDYDKDGYEDLFLETQKGDKIFHNCGDGSFEEVKLPRVDGARAAGELEILQAQSRPGQKGFQESPARVRGSVKSNDPHLPAGPGNPSPPEKPDFGMMNGKFRKLYGGISIKPFSVDDRYRPDQDWNYWSKSPNMFAIPNGNVGIGTKEPSAKLQVDSSSGTAISGNSTSGYGISGSTTSGSGVFGFATAGSGINYGIYGKTNSSYGYAGYFHGNTKVVGALLTTGFRMSSGSKDGYVLTSDSDGFASWSPVQPFTTTSMNPMQIALQKWHELSETGFTLPAGIAPKEMVFDGAHIWVTNPGNNSLTRIHIHDFTTDAFGMETRIDILFDPIAFDGAHVWVIGVLDEGGKFRLFLEKKLASTGDRVDSCELSDFTHSTPEAMAFDGKYIWLSFEEEESVIRILASDCTLPEEHMCDVGQGPHDMVCDGSNIWVSNAGDGTLTKIRTRDCSVAGTYTPPRPSFRIAYDGANILAAEESGSRIAQIRAFDGSLVGSYEVRYGEHGDDEVNEINGIVFDGTNIWVNGLDSENKGIVVKLHHSDRTTLGYCNVGTAQDVPLRGIAFDGVDVWVALPDDNSVTKL